MSGEAPKNEQPAAAAADVVASAKVFVEAAQTAVVKQSEQVKDKVVGTANDTKTTVVEKAVSIKDRAVGTADDTKTSVTEKGVSVKDKVVGAADTTKTSATEQGVSVKDKVVGAVGGALEATKNGVVQAVDIAQSYLNPTTTDAPVEKNKE